MKTQDKATSRQTVKTKTARPAKKREIAPQPAVLVRIGKDDWAFSPHAKSIPYLWDCRIPSAKTLAIPASANSIAGFLDAADAPFPIHAFQPFPRLREIRVDSENKTFESRDGVLYTKGGGMLLFAPDPGRRTFRIPNETSKIDLFAFDICSRLESFEVPPNHPYFSSVDGVLFSRDGRTLVRVPPAWRGELEFGWDCEPVRVAPGAFRGCQGLSGLTFAKLPVPAEVVPEDGAEAVSRWFDELVTELSQLSGLRKFTVGSGTFDLDAKPPRLRQLESLKTPETILENERRNWTAARRARAKRLGPRRHGNLPR